MNDRPEPTRPPRWRRGLLLALLGAQALLTAVYWAWLVRLPHGANYGEVQMLNLAYWWRDGRLPYFTEAAVPAVFNPYGPLSTWLLAQLPTVAGAPYLAGRLAAVACALVVLAAVAVWVRRRTGGWAAAGLAVGLLLAIRPFVVFMPSVRVDPPTILLSVLGFMLAVAAPGPVGAAVGTLLLGLAFHTKLTAAGAALAAVIVLWPTDRRRALAVGAGWLVLALGGLLLLQLASDGLYLQSLLRAANRWGRAVDIATRPFTTSPFWLVAVALAWRTVDADTRRRLRPEATYLAVTFALAVVTGANWGSGWHYLIEPYLALAMLTGGLAAPLLAAPAPRLRVIEGLLVLHAAMAVPYLHTAVAAVHEEAAEHGRRYDAMAARLSPLLAAGERVLVVDSPPGVDVLLHAGQPNALDLPPTSAERLDDLAREAIERGPYDVAVWGEE